MSTANRITHGATFHGGSSHSDTSHGDTPQLANGKLAAQVNGPAKQSATAATRRRASPKRPREQAAAVDAHGTSHAPAPAPPAAASTTHDACAAAACVSSENSAEELVARNQSSGKPGSSSQQQNEKVPVPPGALPLPKDGATFVNAVHEKADLLEVGRMLLNSTDEKIVKAVWDRLVDLRFGAEQTTDANSEDISLEGAPRPIRNSPPATNL